jgi:hypothetical protein
LRYPKVTAIDGILKHAKLSLTREKKQLLLSDLALAFAIQAAAVEVSSTKAAREREVRRRRMRSLARDLAALLRTDAADHSRVMRYYPMTEADPRRVLAHLSWAARTAGKPTYEPPWATDAANRLVAELTSGSHFECLVGEHLGPLFDQYFPKIGPEYTSVDGVPDSPKVRFIWAVLDEFEFTNKGHRYTTGAIADALTRAKNLRKTAAPAPKTAKRASHSHLAV